MTSAGVTTLRRAFIGLLAYTFWLNLSRAKLSSVGSDELVRGALSRKPPTPVRFYPKAVRAMKGHRRVAPATGVSCLCPLSTPPEVVFVVSHLFLLYYLWALLRSQFHVPQRSMQ